THPKKPPAKLARYHHPQQGRISRLGEAPDREGAEAAAIKQFELDQDQRSRLLIRERQRIRKRSPAEGPLSAGHGSGGQRVRVGRSCLRSSLEQGYTRPGSLSVRFATLKDGLPPNPQSPTFIPTTAPSGVVRIWSDGSARPLARRTREGCRCRVPTPIVPV